MPRELEAKIKVDSPGPARSRLQELGAQRLYSALEINQIFDTPDRQLFQRGCGLRVRRCSGQGCVPAATLTYKGPQHPGPLKSRHEIETAIADPESAADIIMALGFGPVIAFEKRREEWELAGVKIALDELPRLGCFVEIEGPDEARVAAVQAQLGLGNCPTIRDSYIALLIDHARANHLPFDCIRFE